MTPKDKWIRALQSGGYRQGRLSMRWTGVRTVHHCALGVLCDVYNPDKWADDAHMGKRLCPHDRILNWVGMSLEMARKISALNDTRHSFPEIARFLQETEIR